MPACRQRAAQRGPVQLPCPAGRVKIPTRPPRRQRCRPAARRPGSDRGAVEAVDAAARATRLERGDRDQRATTTRGSAGAAQDRPRPTTASASRRTPPSRRARRAEQPARPGGRPGLQVVPPSVLAAGARSGAARSAARRPAAEPGGTPAATIPPLSATPGGVTSDQCDEPGAAWKSCQKVFDWVAELSHGHDDPGAARRRDGARPAARRPAARLRPADAGGQRTTASTPTRTHAATSAPARTRGAVEPSRDRPHGWRTGRSGSGGATRTTRRRSASDPGRRSRTSRSRPRASMTKARSLWATIAPPPRSRPRRRRSSRPARAAATRTGQEEPVRQVGQALLAVEGVGERRGPVDRVGHDGDEVDVAPA